MLRAHGSPRRQLHAEQRRGAAWRQGLAKAVAEKVEANLDRNAKAPEPWRWEESEDAVKAYGALAGVLGLGLLPALQTNKLADLPCGSRMP